MTRRASPGALATPDPPEVFPSSNGCSRSRSWGRFCSCGRLQSRGSRLGHISFRSCAKRACGASQLTTVGLPGLSRGLNWNRGCGDVKHLRTWCALGDGQSPMLPMIRQKPSGSYRARQRLPIMENATLVARIVLVGQAKSTARTKFTASQASQCCWLKAAEASGAGASSDGWDFAWWRGLRRATMGELHQEVLQRVIARPAVTRRPVEGTIHTPRSVRARRKGTK